ncbi:hypothetical protein VNI00_014429 [Paramarasmius palmivorus]|uniref:UDP-Glycosyltransferase/glycogen phosphorylase n=1 Tax=Paramarasmius palmivorus TaxID=297713 RepID=A0AAW0BTT4_9AGAR
MHACTAWGHNKPLVTLAILIAEARKNAVVTILTNTPMHTKMMKELRNLPAKRFDAISHRIHIMDVGGRTGLQPYEEVEQVASSLVLLYKQSGDVRCLTSGRTIGGSELPPPSVAIVDPFATYALQALRSVASPQDVPILLWFTSTAGLAIYMGGPKELGGRFDYYKAMLDEEVKVKGRKLEEVVDQLMLPTRGDVVEIPGYPPVYDYELSPQEVSVAGHGYLVYNTRNAVQQVEGTITVATSVLEKDAVQAIRSHYQALGHEWINIGPLSVIPGVKTASAKDEEIESFLDRMEQQFGGQSVVYISFGSVWWPPQVETIWALLDELTDARVPFIMASGSSLAQVPEDVKQRAQESGNGMVVSWAPQEQILNHTATGWFLTHGGWNSTQEALIHKVPLIFWPIIGDQPLNAALLTLKYKAAFELLEVRTGERGTKRPYRCGSDDTVPRFAVDSAKEEFRRMIQSMKGEDGQRVRSNFLQLAEQVAKTWNDGGEAKEQLELFLKKICRLRKLQGKGHAL